MRQWIDGQQQLLELVARGAPLGMVLERLVTEIEAQFPDTLCSVLLLDERGQLWVAAGASIPQAFVDACNGLAMGPAAGSCGTAAYSRKVVVARDIATDPRWVSWRDVALREGLRACWSTPIMGTDANVLGTFALYLRVPGEPSEQQLRFADDAAHIASIAIDRSRVESIVRASEARLREITESIDEMFYVDVLDKSRSHISGYVSPAFERIWRRNRDELTVNPGAWMTSIHRDDIEGVRAAIAARENGARYELEYRIVRPDGEQRWIHDRSVAVRDNDGHITRFIGVVNDITDRKLTELALAESEMRLARIIDSALDAIITVNDAGSIVLFNAAAERVFRTTAAEAMGQSLGQFLPDPGRVASPAGRHRFLQADDPPRGSNSPLVQGRRADGERFPLEASVSRAEVGGRSMLTVILRDVTERQQLELQFRQSQKMEAMGRLAGGIAHDFNNLLTAIRASAELLLDALPPGVQHDDAEEIRLAADRAAALTRQLLAFSRKQVLRTSVLDLNVVVANIETLLRRVLSDRVRISVERHEEPAWTVADAGQLEQILVNLAVNARDALPEGGTITIETVVRAGADLPPHMEVHPQLRDAERVVMLIVRDDGAGMDEDVRTRAFEPFFTTKEPGRGSGLGLATVYGIVEQSGGSTGIESTKHSGTTVWIALPYQAPSVELHAADPPTRSAMPASGTLLVVEDEQAVRTVVCRVLGNAGYTLLVAPSAREAIALWRAHDNGADIDALVTDMIMPEQNGLQLAKTLRIDRPELPVLFMSGYFEGSITETERAPHTAFLEKPFSTEQLLNRIAVLLQV
ncbi:MAG TPA: PAS domain S-box protein [Gemmatimonas sp.]|nr:PAS domain S-box protein [Gemmatimonas sp.]